MRAVSRLFKPGKRQDGQESSDVEAANAPPPPSRRGNRNSRIDDEYDELLVDYLDTIGKSPLPASLQYPLFAVFSWD
jgi:hypothetical protein